MHVTISMKNTKNYIKQYEMRQKNQTEKEMKLNPSTAVYSVLKFETKY